MKTCEQVQRQYCRKVEKACPRALRKRLTAELHSNVSDFLEDHPQSSMEDIVQRFGTPKQFAAEYVASLDDEELTKLLNKRKWFVRWLIIVGSVLVLLVLGTCIWLVKISADSAPTAVEHTIKYESIVTEENAADAADLS